MVAARGDELPGGLDPLPTDVTDEASVTALFDLTVQRYGRVDLLFNNAGMSLPAGDPDTVSLADFAWRPHRTVRRTAGGLRATLDGVSDGP